MKREGGRGGKEGGEGRREGREGGRGGKVHDQKLYRYLHLARG